MQAIIKDDVKEAGAAKAKVSLVKCSSYEQKEVDEALACAIRLLGGFEALFAEGGAGRFIHRDSKLVLKPNLLAKTPPERACTTHPAVFKAAGRLLQEAGYENISYGDSPGNPMIKPEKAAEECGIKAAADELAIPMGSFEHGISVKFPEGRVCSNFMLCGEVSEADGIINICKMKTHQLERITGAVKNTFGCVFGANKSAFHAQFPTAEKFADMLADLNSLVSPKLHIMDGIIAMEGNGPHSGTPKNMNVIMVSTDPAALDTVFCCLVALKPELVPTNVCAMKRGIGTCDPEAIQVVTKEGILTPEEAGKRYGDGTFDVHRHADYEGKLRALGTLASFLEKKPVIRKSRCIGCGVCVQSCPLPEKAIGFKGGHDGEGRCSAGGKGKVPVYDYGRCIKCWCCQEMCPEEAIGVKKSLLLRIAQRMGMV